MCYANYSITSSFSPVFEWYISLFWCDPPWIGREVIKKKNLVRLSSPSDNQLTRHTKKIEPAVNIKFCKVLNFDNSGEDFYPIAYPIFYLSYQMNDLDHTHQY